MITMKKKELLLVYRIIHLVVIAFVVMAFTSCGYSKIKKAKDFVFGEETEYWYVASRNTKHSVTFGSSTSLRDQHGHGVDVDDYGHGSDGKWYKKIMIEHGGKNNQII